MPKSFENSILFDWLTFSTKIYDFHNIITKLGLDGISDWTDCAGKNFYRIGKRFDGISIYWDNLNDPDSLMVNFSGQGCRDFESYSLNPDFHLIFDMFLDGEINITRLDVAYDDFNHILDIDRFWGSYNKGYFVSKFGSASLTHELLNVRPIPVDKGKSLGFGSMKSNVYFRCYDKKLERNREDLQYWVRWECQLRNEAARGFVNSYMTEFNRNVGSCFYSVVNDYIRFCKPSNDSNISRWKPASWWSNFISEARSISLYSSKKVDYNLSHIENYVQKQAGNSLEVLFETIGVDGVLNLVYSRDSDLSPKQKDVISAYNDYIKSLPEGIPF